MKTDEIIKVLKKFYDGTTSVEEEQILLSYFEGDDVDVELLGEKDLFLQLHRSEQIDVTATLESKLNNLIDDLSRQESRKDIKYAKSREPFWVWGVRVAAGIALLVSVGFYFNNRTDIVETPIAQQNEAVIMTETDIQKIKEAQGALILLSSKFNKGVEQLAAVSANLDKTNEILNKSLNRKKNKES